ncbi:hypothetical protein [Tamilnaduibacter salinus]|uniref:hypothetical protein n=1 Tax=Tamilnaduibacter salinus TaxID=1484056 RepID=UPI00117F5BC3|nr:hypothetical protein [Tamilnaduibacter salinus]
MTRSIPVDGSSTISVASATDVAPFNAGVDHLFGIVTLIRVELFSGVLIRINSTVSNSLLH